MANWFTVTIGFVRDGSDEDTVKMVLQRLEGLNVRLTLHEMEPFDATVVNVAYVAPQNGRGDTRVREAGFTYRAFESDHASEGTGPVCFAAYETIERVEIY